MKRRTRERRRARPRNNFTKDVDVELCDHATKLLLRATFWFLFLFLFFLACIELGIYGALDERMWKTEEIKRGRGRVSRLRARLGRFGFSTIPPFWALSPFCFFNGCYRHALIDGHRVYPPDDNTWAGIFFCIIPHLAGDVKAGMFRSYSAFKVLGLPTLDLGLWICFVVLVPIPRCPV